MKFLLEGFSFQIIATLSDPPHSDHPSPWELRWEGEEGQPHHILMMMMMMIILGLDWAGPDSGPTV